MCVTYEKITFSISYEYAHADGESKLQVKASWDDITLGLVCNESPDLSLIFLPCSNTVRCCEEFLTSLKQELFDLPIYHPTEPGQLS
jgi:hypothetical protein